MIVIDCDEEMYLVSVPSVNIIYFILLLCRCSDGDINDVIAMMTWRWRKNTFCEM